MTSFLFETKKLSIVIPVHNRKNYTRSCLISLQDQTVNNFIIVIVDDGSTDGTYEMLINDFPEVKIIKGDGDLWWTKATNLGVKFALAERADYIMTLNNDTVCPPNFIEKMLFWAERKPGSLMGALAVDANNGKLVYGGERIIWSRATSEKVIDELAPEARSGLHRVTHFPGRGLLIPAHVFDRIGLFDEENFLHYVADYDFTQRANRNGFSVYCNYDAPLFTYPEASGSMALLNSDRNLGNYWEHLFGTKGGGNLKYFYNFAFRNCPKKYLLPYLFFGTLRRLFGYWI